MKISYKEKTAVVSGEAPSHCRVAKGGLTSRWTSSEPRWICSPTMVPSKTPLLLQSQYCRNSHGHSRSLIQPNFLDFPVYTYRFIGTLLQMKAFPPLHHTRFLTHYLQTPSLVSDQKNGSMLHLYRQDLPRLTPNNWKKRWVLTMK